MFSSMLGARRIAILVVTFVGVYFIIDVLADLVARAI
jgi:hypothetical protein